MKGVLALTLFHLACYMGAAFGAVAEDTVSTPREKASERRIMIRAGQVSATAVLHQTPTAEAIWGALPIEARANTWGDEIYFSIPVKADLEKDAKEVVESGDLGYWPPGTAFCIFFGPTPASRGNEIRPASAVNMVGQVQGDPKVFKQISSGTKVVIERG
jgi:hypothetical protein